MEKPLVLYGIGDLAVQVFRHFENEQSHRIAAFTADAPYIRSDLLLGRPVVAFETVHRHHPPERFDMLVCIGYKRMRDRKILFEKAKQKGYRLVNVLAPGATVSPDAVFGANNMIFAGVVIDVCVSLGDNNIVRPHTYIGHNVRIGSHNYLAPGCAVAGHGVIGDLCYLGIRSTVIDHVVLENETLIGAGALVLKNTEPASTYLGHPARKTSEHPETGISMKGSSDGG